MNILFLTQSGTLDVFHDVADVLKHSNQIDKLGYYIADKDRFKKFKKRNPEFPLLKTDVLYEWDILCEAQDSQLDTNQLRGMEDRLGDPCLWNVIIADRRLSTGLRSVIEQDYRWRYDHDQLMQILQVAIRKIEELFDQVQPTVVVNFICVSLGDYLGYLVARSRGIPFLNLRPTRVANYFIAGESVHEPSQRLCKTYQHFLKVGIDGQLEEKAKSYLADVRKTHAMYEGVIPATGLIPNNREYSILQRISGFAKTVISLVAVDLDRISGKNKDDNYYVPGLFWLWQEKCVKPWRRRRLNSLLDKQAVSAHDLPTVDYAFYPLHKEPEVTLLVYGRPYVNQIEVVRNLARSLPVGMKLVVKEHPAASGYRPISYYKKLGDIPNVLLLSASIRSREVINNAKLVAVISGSVGFEAVMLKKPVVTLGDAPFNILPDLMVHEVGDLRGLARIVDTILKNHKHEEAALIAYVSAVMQEGVAVDFYTSLLSRKGVYSEAIEGGNDIRKQHLINLSEYIIKQSKSVVEI